MKIIPVNTSSGIRIKRILSAALLPFLTACAFAPGMRLNQAAPTETASAQEPDIQLITPALIQSEKVVKASQAGQDISPLFGAPAPYTIGPGDILSILVWDHPELSVASVPVQSLAANGTNFVQTPAGFVVDHQGMVQFPFVGLLKLSGLTAVEARNLLADKLIAKIKKPDITLRVQSFRSQRIFVDGEVKAPGNQIIDDVPMTLLEGLTRAGGFLPTSDQSDVLVIRNGVTYRVNIPALVQKGIDPAKIMLTNGDVVRVSAKEENKVYVLGEVGEAKALVMNHGRLTLNQALGEARGISPLSGEPTQVYVIRNSGSQNPLVYNLDAKSPVALALADQFELHPRDVVYVDTASIARFSRVVNLLVPGSNALTGTLNATR